MLVTIEQARAHCRADSLDTTVDLYLSAAVSAAAQWLNRRLFSTPQELAAAKAVVWIDLAAAGTAYDAALTAASILPARAEGAARRAALSAFRDAYYKADEICAGIVVNDQINAAILMITGHLFVHRESVVTGTIAEELPHGVHALLWPYRVGLGV